MPQQGFLPGCVAIVVVGPGSGNRHGGHGGLVVSDTAQGRAALGLAVDEHPVVQVEPVGHREESAEPAEIAQELRLRPEHEGPDAGVQSVGADDDVECPYGTGGKRHFDALAGLVNRSDLVAEEIFHLTLGRPVEHLGDVATQNLDLGDQTVPAEHVRTHLTDPLVVAVDDRHPPGVGPRRAHLSLEAHPAHRLLGDAPQVDGLAAGPQRGCPFDDGHREPVAAQAMRQRRPGDAGSGDQHVGDHGGNGTDV